ncbi:hypothetical protein GGR54DRAFT_642732 [Hypoxylon sp. NC1633]|nr:hypothetical protein GGR54DRAFT_642732 [Hypoxylon sp. NC1633]
MVPVPLAVTGPVEIGGNDEKEKVGKDESDLVELAVSPSVDEDVNADDGFNVEVRFGGTVLWPTILVDVAAPEVHVEFSQEAELLSVPPDDTMTVLNVLVNVDTKVEDVTADKTESVLDEMPDGVPDEVLEVLDEMSEVLSEAEIGPSDVDSVETTVVKPDATELADDDPRLETVVRELEIEPCDCGSATILLDKVLTDEDNVDDGDEPGPEMDDAVDSNEIGVPTAAVEVMVVREVDV